MSDAESKARAYCAEIGADPDECVGGYDRDRSGHWIALPRWQFYVVSPTIDGFERALAAQRKEQDSR